MSTKTYKVKLLFSLTLINFMVKDLMLLHEKLYIGSNKLQNRKLIGCMFRV